MKPIYDDMMKFTNKKNNSVISHIKSLSLA